LGRRGIPGLVPGLEQEAFAASLPMRGRRPGNWSSIL
jgi:hypothetical protein